jgi:hypothetical protein
MGSRTRVLPACRIASQPSMLPRRPYEHFSTINIFKYTFQDFKVVKCSRWFCPCVCAQRCWHFERTFCIHLQGRNGNDGREFVGIYISVQQTGGGRIGACAPSGYHSIGPDLQPIPTIKAKLSLCSIKHDSMKRTGDGEGIAPSILNLDTRQFTHWMGPRTGHQTAKTEISPPCLESNLDSAVS